MSDGPFRLRGANITPGQGVPSWPVIPGDTIRAGQTPVVIKIEGCSTITLAPESSGQLDLQGKTPVFRLESGTAHYELTSLTCEKLFAGNTSTVPSSLSGDLQLAKNTLPKGWWTTGHTVAVLGGAGGAAALGVGLAKRKKSNYPCYDDSGSAQSLAFRTQGLPRCDN